MSKKIIFVICVLALIANTIAGKDCGTSEALLICRKACNENFENKVPSYNSTFEFCQCLSEDHEDACVNLN